MTSTTPPALAQSATERRIPEPQRSSGVGKLIALAIIALVLGLLNPTELELRQRIGKDGWAPVEFDRTNVVVCNWVRITGFKGGKATYLAICGGIFKMPWSDD
jgi:hypothetical protein